jgi:hypothetical protein
VIASLCSFRSSTTCSTIRSTDWRELLRSRIHPKRKGERHFSSVPFLMLSAPDIIKVPLHIAQHHQVQETVTVKVDPHSARRPTAPADTRRHWLYQ